jgi:hypothetical protein
MVQQLDVPGVYSIKIANRHDAAATCVGRLGKTLDQMQHQYGLGKTAGKLKRLDYGGPTRWDQQWSPGRPEASRASARNRERGLLAFSPIIASL